MALVNLILCVGMILPAMGALTMLFPDPAATYLRSTGVRITRNIEDSRSRMRFLGVGLLVGGILALGTGALIAGASF
jgi:hypothetical protein